MLTEESIVQREEQVPYKEIEKEGILLHLDSGDYFAVDEVGLLIWKALDGKKNLRQIAERIVSQYKVSENKALRDVVSFTHNLWKKKLVKSV